LSDVIASKCICASTTNTNNSSSDTITTTTSMCLQVRGLCGDMDGSHSGDFMSRAGIEEHLVAFAMSYSSCQDQTPVNYTQPQPCSNDDTVRNYVTTALSLLLRHSVCYYLRYYFYYYYYYYYHTWKHLPCFTNVNKAVQVTYYDHQQHNNN